MSRVRLAFLILPLVGWFVAGCASESDSSSNTSTSGTPWYGGLNSAVVNLGNAAAGAAGK